MDADQRITGNEDEYRNLIKMLHNILQEADACARYALETDEAGNERLAKFF